ncbi:uncharacterized protein PgNI_00713 [Pyricularia grisea]|uniref:Uncharacterized protein n=1 Tax=Pyricularia grisea TaxID=148305 RepID=A0A6P8BGV9_PYRGI|nr:uncharacterized protein PgNI_00713 [Pyricularia grisea]TLD15892.1 hypothetical protein PgNI_00713 [Pyricularia grisea]
MALASSAEAHLFLINTLTYSTSLNTSFAECIYEAVGGGVEYMSLTIKERPRNPSGNQWKAKRARAAPAMCTKAWLKGRGRSGPAGSAITRLQSPLPT